MILTTAFGEFIKKDLEPTNLVMFYLLAVVVSAIWWGQGPAITTSILSLLAFDFFLVPPYFAFTVDDVKYIFTFAVLLIVGIVISTLASKVREQTIRRETEKLQTALLSSISHDLRTPLVSITGALSSLLQESSMNDSTRKEILETAYEDSDRLNRLVGNLLDMTRIEAGTLQAHLRSCELRDLLGASLQQLNDKIGKREVRIHIPHDFPEVRVDYHLMMRVFINLIDNAIKYSPPDAPIEIRSELMQNAVKVEIKDEGFGVPKEDLQRIFDKFYRAVKPNQITGTGLGLSICKGIVEAHGGYIWAQNNSDKGTTLAVVLPTAKGE